MHFKNKKHCSVIESEVSQDVHDQVKSTSLYVDVFRDTCRPISEYKNVLLSHILFKLLEYRYDI